MENDIVTIHVYNTVEKMTRKEAIAKYLEGMRECEGSERERYTNIYFDLIEGKMECFD